MRSGSTNLVASFRVSATSSRRLDLVRGHVDGADQHRLALQELHQLGRHVALPAFQRDLLDLAAIERREGLFVLAPAVAQRLLPLDVGLDAVAVADVHRGRAFQALGRLLQRRHAPLDGLAEIDVEGRLVELDDVDTELLEVARLLVQELGEGEGHLHAVAVVAVGQGVDQGHRTGQRELQLAAGGGAGDARLALVHELATFERRGDRRAIGVIAVVADAHAHLLVEVDAVDLGQEAVHEMLPRLLAVAHDVDAGLFLAADRQQRWRRPWPRTVAGRTSVQGAHRTLGVASHEGLGRLPARVVSNMFLPRSIRCA